MRLSLRCWKVRPARALDFLLFPFSLSLSFPRFLAVSPLTEPPIFYFPRFLSLFFPFSRRFPTEGTSAEERAPDATFCRNQCPASFVVAFGIKGFIQISYTQSCANAALTFMVAFSFVVLLNLVPRARVTLVQRNGNEELWDKAFQIAVSLVENLSTRSRAGGQISFPEPDLPLWALETRVFLTQTRLSTRLGTNNKMAKKMRVSVLDRFCLSHLWM